jgi:hypothetical protein
VPEKLGDADVHGHGTRVAGIVIDGDVSERIAECSFAAPFKLPRPRVVNYKGRFDDVSSINGQMQKAVRALHARGCRIINISLGDAERIPYADGRVAAWASTLDELARTLDVLSIVSAAPAGWRLPNAFTATRLMSHLREEKRLDDVERWRPKVVRH